jgi:predicted outer membrane repeat protein
LYVNTTTCFDNIFKRPRCDSISNAISAFEEIVDMRYGLTPATYYWAKPLTFGREGASVEKYFDKGIITNDTVTVDCMHHRCFKQCLRPKYVPGGTLSDRCFAPSKLIGVRFRNAYAQDGSGSVLSQFPSLEYQQRRPILIDGCVFEKNVAVGNGGALYFFSIVDLGGTTIKNTVFIDNIAIGGSGGGMCADSTYLTLKNVTYVNNQARFPYVCETNHSCQTFDSINTTDNNVTTDNPNANNTTNATVASNNATNTTVKYIKSTTG